MKNHHFDVMSKLGNIMAAELYYICWVKMTDWFTKIFHQPIIQNLVASTFTYAFEQPVFNDTCYNIHWVITTPSNDAK